MKKLPIKIFFYLLLMIIFASSQLGAAATTPPNSLTPFVKEILANGLTVIVKEVHAAPIVAVNLLVKTGSKNELPEEAGISHFFEHMLFKGTAKRPMGRIAQEIEAVGGYLNAATSLDTTSYYVVVPSDYLSLALEVQVDAVLNPSFKAKEIKRERQVIYEEIRLREDSPEGYLADQVYQAVFAKTPYANDILGTFDSLNKLNRASFITYHQKYYAPNNMILTVVGDVDTTQVFQAVKQLFQGVAARSLPSTPKIRSPRIRKIKRLQFHQEVDQTYINMSFIAPAANSKDQAAMSVVANILGQGRGSRLYQDLREEKQLVNSVEVGYQSFQAMGLFSIYVRTPARDTKMIEQNLRQIISQLTRQGITEIELAKAKTMLKSNLAYAAETNLNIATILSEAAADGREAITNYLAKLNQLTVKEVRKVAKKYLKRNGYVWGVITSREGAEQ